MAFFSSIYDIFTGLTILIIGLIISVKISKYFTISEKRALILYLWHTFFCVFYLYYVLSYGGDSIEYYEQSFNYAKEFSFGTSVINKIVSLFSDGLRFSILSVFLVFNIFGVVGLIAFDGSLKELILKKSKAIRILATITVFLPSISFWTSAIGKDGIAFMATGIALWAALNLRSRYLLMIFSVISMLLVRPHMAAIIMFSILISISLDNAIHFKQRFLFGMIAFFCTAIMVPLGLSYSGVIGEDGAGGDIIEYVDSRQSYNQEGGGAIDISSLGLPMQLFTYAFRPLPFEAHSAASLIASFDNTFLLLIFVLGVFKTINKVRNKSQILLSGHVMLWSFSIVSWFVLALTTANSGIAVRQKWMFFPIIIFLMFSMINRSKRKY